MPTAENRTISSRGDAASSVQAGAQVADTSARGTRIVKVAINGETFEIRERVDGGRHSNEHEYQFDKMQPGPLTDPRRVNDSLATGFFGGKYDELVLGEDKLLYRICTAKEGRNGVPALGRWYTEKPLQSGLQLQIDAAVKPVWQRSDGSIGAVSPAEVAITIRVPKGTKFYRGPVASQGAGHLGGSDQIQIYIPGIRNTPGVEVLVVEPFQPHGHAQPNPRFETEPK